MPRTTRTAIAALLAALVAWQAPALARPLRRPGPPAASEPPTTPTDAVPPTSPAVPPQETALRGLLGHGGWIRRMAASMRLERPGIDGAKARLLALATDPDPRVRCSAVLALRNAGHAAPAALGDAEQDPRVLRTMLRCGWALDADRIERGARLLVKSPGASDRLLGVELIGALAAQGRASPALGEFAKDALASVIARLDRDDGGALSPRIAALTGASDTRVHWRWRSWLDRNRGSMRIDGGMAAAPVGEDGLNPVARLDEARFVAFVTALDELFPKPVDLAFAIDCTASMSAELAQAQAGIDDLMAFVNGSTAGMRVAIVGFRDRGDEWKTMPFDFTPEPSKARERLWRLSAEGGGDEPELVHDALKLAYRSFSWRPDAARFLVLVGDAPPHPGWGGASADLAREARRAGIVTHVLSARPKSKEEEVKHFPEIARAGGGTVVRLDERRELLAQVAGLVLSDTWGDQMTSIFERYLALCR